MNLLLIESNTILATGPNSVARNRVGLQNFPGSRSGYC